MTGPDLPAFDPAHPDSEILGAFERVRRHRVAAYAREDMGDAGWVETDHQAHEDLEDECSRFITGNFASTPAGVAARLAFALPDLTQSRRVDRGIMEHGIVALYQSRGELSVTDSQIVQAACELLYIEWDQAFGAYERAAELEQFALAMKARTEEARFRDPKPAADFADFATCMDRVAEDFVKRCGTTAALDRLVRTLAPDREAYDRKVSAIMSEQYDGAVVPWLARDTAFLLGRMPPAEPQGAAA